MRTTKAVQTERESHSSLACLSFLHPKKKKKKKTGKTHRPGQTGFRRLLFASAVFAIVDALDCPVRLRSLLVDRERLGGHAPTAFVLLHGLTPSFQTRVEPTLRAL